MREVFFLLDATGNLLFSDASESPSALPDSRRRWEAIWQHRDSLAVLAHSHPRGPLAFSKEDETTMAALESALGRELCFAVVAPDGVIEKTGARVTRLESEPAWADELRVASRMSQAPERKED
jgi:hypothetical protein